MPTCPDGHNSESAEYCSACGLAITICCPHCSEPRIGPFCENCGHAYATPALAASSWYALVAPDLAYFKASGTSAQGFSFPDPSPPRSIAMAGASVRIGRRSLSRGITPEIDLSQPPGDPGVSREHARLLAQPGHTWAVIDDGSTNGTYLNGGHQPIPAHQQVSLAEGDRVHLGVWTTITLCRGP
jgi:FHA domain